MIIPDAEMNDIAVLRGWLGYCRGVTSAPHTVKCEVLGAPGRTPLKALGGQVGDASCQRSVLLSQGGSAVLVSRVRFHIS